MLDIVNLKFSHKSSQSLTQAVVLDSLKQMRVSHPLVYPCFPCGTPYTFFPWCRGSFFTMI